MSIGQAAREKIQAFEDGDVVDPGAAGDDTQQSAHEQAPGEPGSESGSGSAPAPDEPEVITPTEEEEEAAEEAADAAADALGEDATEEEREQARQEARDEFFLGTYRSKEDAERGLAEKDETLKRLFSEKNLLEQRLREAEDRRQQEEAEPQELDLPAWDQWALEQVEAGAGQAGAMAALREGGYEGYQVYLRHWLASEDPAERAEATLYNNEVVMSIAEVRAAVASQQARQQPSAAEQREQAYAQLKLRRPDLDDYHEQMTAIVSELPQEDILFLRRLAETGVEGQMRATEWLYQEAKSRGSSTSEAQKVERQRRKASAAAATVQATSPSAEGTSSRTPPPAAEAEALKRKAGIRERMNLKPLDDE